MDYDYDTRKKLVESFKRKWNKKLLLAGKELKEQSKQLEELEGYRSEPLPILDEARNKLIQGGFLTLSDMMKAHYGKLVELYAGKQYREDFYTIIDKLNQFPYWEGMDRRTVRTKKYFPQMEHVFSLLVHYRTLEFYGCSIEDYLLDRMTEEKLDCKRNYMYHFSMNRLDDMIAVRIDKEDPAVIGAVKDLILSDNNTAVITTDTIRGILKSSNGQLHQLLADFLLAARLQEGVRQAICENADCGTIEGFRKIFDTVYEHGLVRFAAVKRAIATWTGICDLENVDRITEKMLGLMHTAFQDQSVIQEYLKSNDSIQIAIGLWTLGSFEIQDAIVAMEEYLAHGTRNQILTMSYFNRTLEWSQFTGVASKKAVVKYAGDAEILAAFMPTYLDEASNYAYAASNTNQNRNQKVKKYLEIDIYKLFESENEAREHYGIMKTALEGMQKKVLEFSPCIYPWYRVCITKSDLIEKMCTVAYALKDSVLKEEMAEKLPLLDVSGNVRYYSRSLWVELFLHRPENDKQKRLLLACVADKESTTRDRAFEIVRELPLVDEDVQLLEGFLKYKTGDIRRNVLSLLGGQEDAQLEQSVGRLLKSSNEQIRDGALSLILEAKKTGRKDSLLAGFAETVQTIEAATDKEQLLIQEITGGQEVMQEEGFGLYQPSYLWDAGQYQTDAAFLKDYFSVSKKELDSIIQKLIDFLEKHAQLEYKNAGGDEMLLGNGLYAMNYDRSADLADQYPFRELWEQFYDKEIHDAHILQLLQLTWYNRIDVSDGKIKNQSKLERHVEQLLGSTIPVYRVKSHAYTRNNYNSPVQTVFRILESIHQDRGAGKAALALSAAIIREVPEQELWYQVEQDEKRYYYSSENNWYALTDFPPLKSMLSYLEEWETEEEFKENFRLLYQLDRRFKYNKQLGEERYSRGSTRTWLTVNYYLKACVLGMLPKEAVIQAIFESIGLNASLEALSRLIADPLTPYDRECLKKFFPAEELEKDSLDPENEFVKIGREIYFQITDKILDIELKRGEMETVFSKNIFSMKRIFGMKRLVDILKALGNDKLDRASYYYWSNRDVSRKECLSHLLQICYPMKEDSAAGLKELLEKSKIKEQKIIETAMYAPQWLTIIEEYLEWPGLKSGCYYFMAHMNESFDDRKKAMIARYTPLTSEELGEGAFDVNWFQEAYGQLGEERFYSLYDAAKYISDGSKHARARKYADAALGKVTLEQLEPVLLDKRNKDLLMSYGLVPVQGKQDLLHRYEFLQDFKKAGKQFGAQRKASEGAAVNVAMKNMSTAAGYKDVTRLTLAMETELVKAYEVYFQDHEVEGVLLKLCVDENGKVEVCCEKDGKTLKSAPAKLKKAEYYIQLKEVHKKLKEQYSRTVKMLEQSMEEREIYQAGELEELCANPVIEPIIKSLVLMAQEEPNIHGYRKGLSLWDCYGEEHVLSGETAVRICHPADLYAAGCWHTYQKKLFEDAADGKVRKQPFKQVFRELYVKLPEELEKERSTMFAGNQIQPSKTAACLKTRRWVADYEEGLQKIYYKENLIARIYALADWFSPSDIEAPTLEWVEFTDRLTFRSVKLKEIPEIVYSEVMRDVDLAVSVAHAGGVDPETSHSTIEMRRAVLEFGLPLFKIKNVVLEGSHAMIEGKRGSYNIHLGSGVIHQQGGHQINVLPVHSQGRGKLFLPFLDEDPKTAEIISKILLFAEDMKIKDPYILDQLVVTR